MSDMDDFPLEFSRTLAIDNIAPGGSVLELQATEAECRKLAERFGLLSLDRLVAHLTVTRGASGIPIRVRGRLEASVVQECIVSLEPIASKIKEVVEVEYSPAADAADELVFGLDEMESPEPLEGDSLELGELVAQYLSVTLDPYPRKEGGAPPEWDGKEPEKGGKEAESPFSVLASLGKKRP